MSDKSDEAANAAILDLEVEVKSQADRLAARMHLSKLKEADYRSAMQGLTKNQVPLFISGTAHTLMRLSEEILVLGNEYLSGEIDGGQLLRLLVSNNRASLDAAERILNSKGK